MTHRRLRTQKQVPLPGRRGGATATCPALTPPRPVGQPVRTVGSTVSDRPPYIILLLSASRGRTVRHICVEVCGLPNTTISIQLTTGN